MASFVVVVVGFGVFFFFFGGGGGGGGGGLLCSFECFWFVWIDECIKQSVTTM